MLGLGSKTSSMAKEWSDGPTMHLMMASTNMARNTVGACSAGQTELRTKASSKTITSREKAFISGQMDVSSLEIGLTIRCTGEVLSFGLTADGMRVTMFQIRKKAMANSNGKSAVFSIILGLMEKSIKVSGKMAGSMESAHT